MRSWRKDGREERGGGREERYIEREEANKQTNKGRKKDEREVVGVVVVLGWNGWLRRRWKSSNILPPMHPLIHPLGTATTLQCLPVCLPCPAQPCPQVHASPTSPPCFFLSLVCAYVCVRVRVRACLSLSIYPTPTSTSFAYLLSSSPACEWAPSVPLSLSPSRLHSVFACAHSPAFQSFKPSSSLLLPLLNSSFQSFLMASLQLHSAPFLPVSPQLPPPQISKKWNLWIHER